MGNHGLASLGDQPTTPTNLSGDHRHRVLGNHRVIQHRRVQHPLHRPDNTPVSATTARTASNTRSGAELFRSLAATSQHRRVEPSSVNAKPAAAFQRISQRNRPIASRSDSPSNACNTNTVATTKSRYRRATPTTEQIPEQPVREHPPPMHGQKPVNRPHWNQITTHRQRIQQLPIKTFSTQHPPNYPKNQ